MRLATPVFSALWCTAYTLALALELPLFYYYPLEQQWHLTPLADSAGPAMPWYGLVASATLVALPGAVIFQWLVQLRASKVFAASTLIWLALVPVLAMLGCATLMLGFFV